MKRILLFFIIIIVMPILVYGNAASPYQRPSDNAILFDDNTGISLKEEWVNFKIDNNSDKKTNIEVTYLLENINRENTEIEMLFIAPYLNSDDIKITLNNEEITSFTMKKTEELPENWYFSNKITITEPLSKKILQNRLGNGSYYEGWNEEGFQFKINIPKGETKKLSISYLSEGGYYSFDDVVNDVNTQLYYLTPAKFWDGQTKVHLRVEFPDNNYEIYSNIKLDKISNKIYEGFLDEIPQNEWYFNYVNKEGLIFNINDRTQHNLIALGIVLFTILIGFLFKKKNKIVGILLWILVIPELWLFRPTYGTMFLMIFVGPILLGILGLIVISIYLTKKRKSSL